VVVSIGGGGGGGAALVQVLSRAHFFSSVEKAVTSFCYRRELPETSVEDKLITDED
jgi:hypothetical protein